MIGLIKKYMSLGLCFSLQEAEFNRYKIPRTLLENPYTWSCLMLLAGIQQWTDKIGFDGKIAYFFEAGHEYQRHANDIMSLIYSVPNMRKKYRYISHSFVDKQAVRPVQTADMLAWHQAKWIKDYYETGKTTKRKDFEALCERDTFQNHHTAKNFIGFRENVLNAPPNVLLDVLGDLLGS